MQSGAITIDGDCGRHLGSEMSGGTITVHGHAGDWIGGMKGGLIHVHGNAGHQVGAAYRGSERGMNRGTIIIDGNAGNEIGLTMRRGLIGIGGNAGDLIGFNMLAELLWFLVSQESVTKRGDAAWVYYFYGRATSTVTSKF